MYVSEITYGNWITHGSQVDSDAAKKCVKAALDSGITTFDTADSYAFGRAETVLGKSLKGVKRESYELITKIYWPTGEGKNDRGLSRKHIFESFHDSLKRLQTDHLDVLICHRYDHETPLEETVSALNDLVRQGKVHYVGVSEWNAEEIRKGLAIQDKNNYNRFITNQAQYSALYRVIEK